MAEMYKFDQILLGLGSAFLGIVCPLVSTPTPVMTCRVIDSISLLVNVQIGHVEFVPCRSSARLCPSVLPAPVEPTRCLLVLGMPDHLRRLLGLNFFISGFFIIIIIIIIISAMYIQYMYCLQGMRGEYYGNYSPKRRNTAAVRATYMYVRTGCGLFIERSDDTDGMCTVYRETQFRRGCCNSKYLSAEDAERNICSYVATCYIYVCRVSCIYEPPGDIIRDTCT
jgi:hypothetical protein